MKVIKLLLSTVDDKGNAGFDTSYGGYGRLNTASEFHEGDQ